MEAQLLKSIISDIVSNEVLVTKKLGTVIELLQEHRLLTGCLRDSEDDMSKTAKQSQKIFKKWVASVNLLLNSKQDQLKSAGFVLLHETLSISTHDIFTSHFDFWSSELLEVVKQSDTSSVFDTALVAATTFILRSLEFSDLRREIHKNHLGKFIQALLTALESYPNRRQIFVSLASFIPHISMNSKPLRKKLEEVFLGLLGHQDDECLTQVALTLSLLPDTEESWKGLVTQLIERVHVALDTVYNGLEDVDHQEQYGRIKTEAEAKMLDIEIYERRVRGAVRTIELMFGNKYAFEVELPLRRVFNLMLRVFSVDGSVLTPAGDNFFTQLDIARAISSYHQIGFEFISACIINLKFVISPYLEIISELLIQGLARGKQRSCAPLHGTSIRVKQYELMSNLFVLFGPTLATTLCKRVIPHLLNDVQFKTQAIKMGSVVALNEGARAEKKKKQKQAKQTAEQITLVIDQRHDVTLIRSVPLRVRQAALSALEILLRECGSYLGDQRVLVDQALITLGMQLLGHSVTVKQFFASNTNLRLSFYRAVIGAVMSPQATQPSVMPYAIKFIQHGLNDSSFVIQSYCQHGMQIIDGLTNPRVAPLPPPVIPVSEHLSLTSAQEQLLIAEPYDVPRPMATDSDDSDEEMNVDEQDLTPVIPVSRPTLQRDPSGYMADGEDLARSAQLPSFSFGGFGAKSPSSKSTPANSVPKESLSPVPRQKEITASISIGTHSLSNSVATVTSTVTRVSTTASTVVASRPATHNDDELPDIVLDDGPDDSDSDE